MRAVIALRHLTACCMSKLQGLTPREMLGCSLTTSSARNTPKMTYYWIDMGQILNILHCYRSPILMTPLVLMYPSLP